jgi:hypothetical protein
LKLSSGTFLRQLTLSYRRAPVGARVLTVKLGFVKTKMTAGLKPPGGLSAEPRAIGEGVFRSTQRNSDVDYLPRIWLVVMLIIKAIPERVFKTMKI